MASWAGIIQQSGFHFSAVDKAITFTKKAGKYFWSNGSAWGMCEIAEDKEGYQVNFSVQYGKIELKTFALGEQMIKELKQTMILNENQSAKFVLKSK